LCWLHSVGQNHFYVMLLLSQGFCFIQSLLFSYVLQEDSVKFSRKFILVPCQLSGRSSVSNMRPDDVVFRPDAHQCLEASKSSRLWNASIPIPSFMISGPSRYEIFPVKKHIHAEYSPTSFPSPIYRGRNS
jgi:hypothetical protein